MGNNFESLAALSPQHSVHDLSHEFKFTGDMGQLIPVMCDEVVPGDSIKLGNQMVIRFAPTIAPIMHEINAFVHYFFVPYRILWDLWESFITGGKNGDDASVLPTWTPGAAPIENSLWDYLGFPTGVIPTGFAPLDFPRRAYNLIYNQYYRDENLQDEIALNSELVRYRAWKKDYFTSALPWQQRGIAPALPISGSSAAIFPANINAFLYEASDAFANKQITNDAQGNASFSPQKSDGSNFGGNKQNIITQIPKSSIDNNIVSFASAATFNVSDLRLAFQIQKWMERNARGGVRYNEFVKMHYGVDPGDARLQRAEYIGGSKNPVIISEVLQTSSTDATSPQGNLAGHGIVAGQTFCGRYKIKEHGLVMGIMSVMPEPTYQQGINRQWIKRSRYDFFTPEFANLSEQAIERGELYATGVQAENRTVFGFQGRFDELRYKPSRVAGAMRSTLKYWHLGRIFAAAPLLNESFISSASIRKDIFAVPAQPGLLVNIRNIFIARRPIPFKAEPGRIDHW